MFPSQLKQNTDFLSWPKGPTWPGSWLPIHPSLNPLQGVHYTLATLASWLLVKHMKHPSILQHLIGFALCLEHSSPRQSVINSISRSLFVYLVIVSLH